MKIAWLTDIHLNFLDEPEVAKFLHKVATLEADLLLICGDVGESNSVGDYLDQIAASSPVPVYFVLGNHDFYLGSISEVRNRISQQALENDRLVYLTSEEVQSLGQRIALIGDDGWADARLGDPYGTSVELNDFRLIDELTGLERVKLVSKLKNLGRKAAMRLAPKLKMAIEGHDHILIATHVPPFRDAILYEGRVADDEWLPWFSCHAIGEVVRNYADAWPDKKFTLFCGHTHHRADLSLTHNLSIKIADAEYGNPCIESILIAAV